MHHFTSKIIFLAPLLFFAARPIPALSDDIGPFAPLETFWSPPSVQEVAYYKVKKMIDTLVRGIPIKKHDTVIASTCRRSLILSEFLDQKELENSPTPSLRDIPKLSQKPKNLHSIFKLIRVTALGRAILKKFYPHYGFDIKVVFRTKKQIRSLTHNMALASFDPVKKIIRINSEGEIGAISYVLVHEIIHALDTDYAIAVQKQIRLRKQFEKGLKQLVRKTASRLGKPKDQLSQMDFPSKKLRQLVHLKSIIDQMYHIQIFRAERFAYDASYDVHKELSKYYPKYYRRLPTYRSDDRIIKLNQLNLTYINKYRAGLCTTYKKEMVSK